jgi:hypothetical protein
MYVNKAVSRAGWAAGFICSEAWGYQVDFDPAWYRRALDSAERHRMIECLA